VKEIFLVGWLCGGRSGPRVEHNSTPFNFLQLRAAGKPDATRSLSLKVSSLTGATSLLDDACMDVPLETVDMQPVYVYVRDLFPAHFSKGGSFVRLASSGAPGRSVPRLSLLLSSRQLSQWARGGS